MLACASTVGSALFCYYSPTVVALVNAVTPVISTDCAPLPSCLADRSLLALGPARLVDQNVTSYGRVSDAKILAFRASGASTGSAPVSILTGADGERIRVGVVGGTRVDRVRLS